MAENKRTIRFIQLVKNEYGSFSSKESERDFTLREQAAVNRFNRLMNELEATSPHTFANEIIIFDTAHMNDETRKHMGDLLPPTVTIDRNNQIKTTLSFITSRNIGEIIAVLKHEMKGHIEHEDIKTGAALDYLISVVHGYYLLEQLYTESPNKVAAWMESYFGNSENAKTFFKAAYADIKSAISIVTNSSMQGLDYEEMADFISAYPEESKEFTENIISFHGDQKNSLLQTLERLNNLPISICDNTPSNSSDYGDLFRLYISPIAINCSRLIDFDESYRNAAEFRADEAATAGGRDNDGLRQFLKWRKQCTDAGMFTEEDAAVHPEEAWRYKRIARLERQDPLSSLNSGRSIGYRSRI